MNQNLWIKVRKYFNDDISKTWDFFRLKNPHLGMISPLEMIKLGRINKLEKFIDGAINENYRL